jgi:hypothetical protein
MQRTYGDIQRTLRAIEEAWTKHPELRLGQLLVNANPRCSDIFYVADGEWSRLLKEFGEENGR